MNLIYHQFFKIFCPTTLLILFRLQQLESSSIKSQNIPIFIFSLTCISHHINISRIQLTFYGGECPVLYQVLKLCCQIYPGISCLPYPFQSIFFVININVFPHFTQPYINIPSHLKIINLPSLTATIKSSHVISVITTIYLLPIFIFNKIFSPICILLRFLMINRPWFQKYFSTLLNNLCRHNSCGT